MKISYFATNLSLIRSVWGINRAQLAQLLNCSSIQIGTYERGAVNIPIRLILDLESKTGITPRQLYFEYLARTAIPQHPLTETSKSKTKPEAFLQQSNDDLSLLERVKRLEIKVFGA
jgi:transcriptional regulator with XRE-family HTH domain